MEVTAKRVELSSFALAALGQRQADAASELALAVAFYLADHGADRPGWPYPAILPALSGNSEATVAIDLSPKLWDALAAEAERQEVAVDRLASHAAIYFAAELDAGRITERILADLESVVVGDAADSSQA